MKFNSEVIKINTRDKDSSFVLAFSNDESAQVFNSEKKLTATCHPGHVNHRAKNGMVSADGSVIATTGSDGYLNIYEMEE